MKSMCRVMAFAVAIIAILTISSGCESDGPDKQPSEDRSVLRVGYSPLSLNAPLFAALDLDLFPGPVEERRFSTTNEMVAALISGRIDLASAAPTEVVLQANFLDSGAVKTVLYNAFTTLTRADAIVAQDTVDFSCSELPAGTIATYPAESTVTYLKSVYGSSQEVMQVPPSSILEAVAQGRVATAYLLEPQVTAALNRGIARPICWSPLARELGDTVLVGSHAINSRTLEQRGWNASDILSAMKTAVDTITSDTTYRAGITTEFTELPRTLTGRIGFPVWLVASEATLGKLKDTCELLSSSGAIDGCPDLELSQIGN